MWDESDQCEYISCKYKIARLLKSALLYCPGYALCLNTFFIFSTNIYICQYFTSKKLRQLIELKLDCVSNLTFLMPTLKKEKKIYIFLYIFNIFILYIFSFISQQCWTIMYSVNIDQQLFFFWARGSKREIGELQYIHSTTVQGHAVKQYLRLLRSTGDLQTLEATY